MAGGSGERFWPLSTSSRPKQLLKLTSATETMLEEASKRIGQLVGMDSVFLATTGPLREAIVAEGVVPAERVYAEPGRRNTLGCLAWVVANFIAEGRQEAVLAILTADHKIDEPDKFRETVEAAMLVAETEGSIVTIGVTPTRPETGYGYIEFVKQLPVEATPGYTAYAVRRFREKPNLETAENFLAAGTFAWNSGMFFFTIDTFLRELLLAQPEAHEATMKMVEAIKAKDLAAAKEAFDELPNLPVDIALIEHARRLHMVPAEFPWDDVGAWDALDRSLEADGHGNVLQGDVAIIETRNSIVVNDAGVALGVLGLEEVIVVVTNEGILVASKDHAQSVKKVVAALNNKA